MRRGQVLRRADRLAPVLHRSHGARDASRRRRRGFSVGGLSRAAVKRLWTFSSRRKNRRSASTAPASRHAASSMKSDRFFPSASAARSIRARCLRFARRLIVTSRPCRSCLSVLAMGLSSCIYHQLQSCPHIVNTRSSGGSLQGTLCNIYGLYMKLAADPATETWLLGLTGADHEFDWDSGNLTKNRKHGVEPRDVEALIGGDFYFAGRIVEPVHSEPRWLALGEDATGRRLSLVFTRRGTRLRAISCRAMRRKEEALYEEARRQED